MIIVISKPSLHTNALIVYFSSYFVHSPLNLFLPRRTVALLSRHFYNRTMGTLGTLLLVYFVPAPDAASPTLAVVATVVKTCSWSILSTSALFCW